MKKLANKEEEVMKLFWDKGPMFVREMVELYDEPKPHFNTISTIVRSLERKGFVGHKSYGPTYLYFPIVSQDEYSANTMKNIVSRYFKDSYVNVVSFFVKKEKVSIDELKALIKEAEKEE
ncbi:MAG: BlaI/MecI/CopY family transcriptional regulator [Bacteroidaceae bacterium]|nr:BlaI/MecI/CopY family transcriptional regulator [Bacteroidaceae bacterium]